MECRKGEEERNGNEGRKGEEERNEVRKGEERIILKL